MENVYVNEPDALQVNIPKPKLKVKWKYASTI